MYLNSLFYSSFSYSLLIFCDPVVNIKTQMKRQYLLVIIIGNNFTNETVELRLNPIANNDFHTIFWVLYLKYT